MIVDDENSILNMVGQMLERLGYRVIMASDGEMAVDTFREMQSEIDGILLDISMPRMDGKECIKHLLKIGTACYLMILFAIRK